MVDVSMEMIQSAGFHEMLAMQSSTVCALWGRLKQAIDCKWLVFLDVGSAGIDLSYTFHRFLKSQAEAMVLLLTMVHRNM